jgi:hypothetical protein
MGSSLRRIAMTVSLVALILIVLLVFALVPAWPYSRSWGYAPSGGLGLVALVLIILLLMGAI